MWPNISAWYPPVKFALAMLVGLGPKAIPMVVAGAYLSGVLNYGQKIDSVGFLFLNPLILMIYILTALATRRWISADRKLHTMKDVLRFLGTCLVASFSAAFIGTGLFAWVGNVDWHDYKAAAFSWWVGDAVALSSVTPFLLEFALPPLKRFLRARSRAPRMERPENKREVSGKNPIEAAEFGGALLSSFYVVFESHLARSANLFYLFFLAIIWMAMRRGLRGVICGLVALDLCLILFMNLVPQGLEDLALLQFLMLILALTGLILGALVDERNVVLTRSAGEAMMRAAGPESRPPDVLLLVPAAGGI